MRKRTPASEMLNIRVESSIGTWDGNVGPVTKLTASARAGWAMVACYEISRSVGGKLRFEVVWIFS